LSASLCPHLEPALITDKRDRNECSATGSLAVVEILDKAHNEMLDPNKETTHRCAAGQNAEWYITVAVKGSS